MAPLDLVFTLYTTQSPDDRCRRRRDKHMSIRLWLTERPKPGCDPTETGCQAAQTPHYAVNHHAGEFEIHVQCECAGPMAGEWFIGQLPEDVGVRQHDLRFWLGITVRPI